jgi:hypothetical protein
MGVFIFIFFATPSSAHPTPPLFPQVEPHVQKLYDYILERGGIVPVTHFDAALLSHGDVSKLVAESIRAGTPDWEGLVPHHVRDQIKALNLLGYRGEEGGGKAAAALPPPARGGVTRTGSARGAAAAPAA